MLESYAGESMPIQLHVNHGRLRLLRQGDIFLGSTRVSGWWKSHHYYPPSCSRHQDQASHFETYDEVNKDDFHQDVVGFTLHAGSPGERRH